MNLIYNWQTSQPSQNSEIQNPKFKIQSSINRMCGRVVCHSTLDEFATALEAVVETSASMVYQPSYNIAPSQPLPIVCSLQSIDPQLQTNQRLLMLAKWGLLPQWAKDESLAYKTFNARAETIQEKPSFRGAFKYRRCLIPVNGYYEWHRSGKTKSPYYFSRSDQNTLVLAGLFELWQESLVTCTVITTEANDMARDIHHRMPVILDQHDWKTWVEANPKEASSLLKPAPEDLLKVYPVDSAVNNTRNNTPELIVPLQ